MDRPKRIVHYDASQPSQIMLGFGALVKTIDHSDSSHVTNKKMVLTSKVISYDGNGCFETKNSLYIPIKVN